MEYLPPVRQVSQASDFSTERITYLSKNIIAHHSLIHAESSIKFRKPLLQVVLVCCFFIQLLTINVSAPVAYDKRAFLLKRCFIGGIIKPTLIFNKNNDSENNLRPNMRIAIKNPK